MEEKEKQRDLGRMKRGRFGGLRAVRIRLSYIAPITSEPEWGLDAWPCSSRGVPSAKAR